MIQSKLPNPPPPPTNASVLIIGYDCWIDQKGQGRITLYDSQNRPIVYRPWDQAGFFSFACAHRYIYFDTDKSILHGFI